MSFSLKRTLGISKGGGGQNYLNEALAGYRNLQNPNLNDQLIQQSALQTMDPTARNATLSALTQMQDIANQGGMTAIDRSRLQQIKDNAATQARGAREAIAENAAQRGIGGSGFELAQSMLGQQAASDNAARQAIGVNSAAQERALAAMQASGQLGSQMNQQDMAKANALDAIKEFNTGVRQQQYENDFNKAQGMAGVYGNQANLEQERINRQNQWIGGGLGALSSMFGGKK